MPQSVVLSRLVDGKNEDLGRVVHIEVCRKEQNFGNQKIVTTQRVRVVLETAIAADSGKRREFSASA